MLYNYVIQLCYTIMLYNNECYTIMLYNYVIAIMLYNNEA